MRRYFFLTIPILALLVFFTAKAHASIVYVSSNAATPVVATSTTLTISTTAGNLLVVSMKMSSTGSSPTIGDTAGNIWTLGTNLTTALPYTLKTWYAIAVSTVSDTITVSSTNNVATASMVDQFSGTATVNPLDASSTTDNGGSGQTICTTGPVTPAKNNELIWGDCGQETANSFGLTPGTGFTITTSTTRIGAQYKVQTTAQSVSSTITVGTSDGLAAAMMTFKAPSTPTAAPTRRIAHGIIRPSR
jgi:hypothetical protein